MNDQGTHAERLATEASAAVLAAVDAEYDDREEAAPLMYLLMVAEQIAELGGPTATTDDIDVYSLIYKTPTGTVVVDNDEIWCREGECTVAYYHGDGWRESEEPRQSITFDSVRSAAYFAKILIRAPQSAD